MSDIMAYSASLTGALGKVIEPKIVTVAKGLAKKGPNKLAHATAKKPEGKGVETTTQGHKS